MRSAKVVIFLWGQWIRLSIKITLWFCSKGDSAVLGLSNLLIILYRFCFFPNTRAILLAAAMTTEDTLRYANKVAAQLQRLTPFPDKRLEMTFGFVQFVCSCLQFSQYIHQSLGRSEESNVSNFLENVDTSQIFAVYHYSSASQLPSAHWCRPISISGGHVEKTIAQA